MMLQGYDEKERNAIYYPVDLRIITEVASDISRTADGLGQPWYKLDAKSIENILLAMLKLNYVLNLRAMLVYHNKSIPDMYLMNMLQSCVLVPRFVRDMFREILRPMHHSGITYLPDISLQTLPTPQLLDMFYPISGNLTRWHNLCQKIGFEMVPIFPEVVQSVSLTFYSYETDEMLSFDNIVTLDWRLESFGRTKHLVYNPTSDVEEPDKTLIATSKKKAQEKEVIKSTVKPIYEREILDRRILGMIVYRYTCAPYPTVLGYIPSDYRFPTDERHSQTPPQSNRVLESVQTMGHAAEKRKKKNSPPKIVSVE